MRIFTDMERVFQREILQRNITGLMEIVQDFHAGNDLAIPEGVTLDEINNRINLMKRIYLIVDAFDVLASEEKSAALCAFADIQIGGLNKHKENDIAADVHATIDKNIACWQGIQDMISDMYEIISESYKACENECEPPVEKVN